jgi:Kef-type K+ transport system membrane component KefB
MDSQTAALWIALALAASLVSIRTGISVALVEIGFGVLGGNYLGLHSVEWINFLAGFGSVLLTFLAGAEIDPETLRRRAKESFSIGIAAFLIPFVGVWLACQYGLHWDHNAALIGGIALSTTSVAVVYAVMVETGLNSTELGRILLAACFINDLGTVLALGVLFASYNVWLVIFVSVTALIVALTQPVARWFFETFGGHVSEPEIKFIFLLLFGLGALAVKANSEPVLGAYLLGLVVASIFSERKTMVSHLRTTSFALLTPFYFLKAGTLVSLPALSAGLGVVALLLGAKIATKFVGFTLSPRRSGSRTGSATSAR